jgi:predicted nucleotidyltransferase
VGANLVTILAILKKYQPELHKRGVVHAAVFGSVARGQGRPESDIDVLIDLDPERPIGVFEYARLKLYINEIAWWARGRSEPKKAQADAAGQHPERIRECLLRTSGNGSATCSIT